MTPLRVVAPSLLLALAATVAHASGDHGPHAHAATARQPWGVPADASRATRTIEIAAGDDMRFQPSSIQVRRGETVRFVLHNTGKLAHEWVLGSGESLEAHAKAMREQPAMAHDEPGTVQVAPGATATLAWTFDRTGRFGFACLLPGHLEAGMKGAIVVR